MPIMTPKKFELAEQIFQKKSGFESPTSGSSLVENLN